MLTGTTLLTINFMAITKMVLYNTLITILHFLKRQFTFETTASRSEQRLLNCYYINKEVLSTNYPNVSFLSTPTILM